jgi:predicted DsbA family dithiol-disulfide isomerase
VSADATNGVNQVVAQIKQYAASLNLDTNAFNSCLDSGADQAKVAADQKAMSDALSQAGVSSFGTPSFFINGRFVSGAYPYDSSVSGYVDGMFTFKQAIEDSLAQ